MCIWQKLIRHAQWDLKNTTKQRIAFLKTDFNIYVFFFLTKESKEMDLEVKL